MLLFLNTNIILFYYHQNLNVQNTIYDNSKYQLNYIVYVNFLIIKKIYFVFTFLYLSHYLLNTQTIINIMNENLELVNYRIEYFKF